MLIRSSVPSFWNDDEHKDMFYNLQDEVERVFRQFQNGAKTRLNANQNDEGSGALMPRINVAETENQIKVNVELPGVEQKDIEVSVANKKLTIEGHKKTESEVNDKDYRLVERSEGRFKRVIPLGFDLEDENVVAHCKDGVLSIAINKPAELAQKTRKIEVKHSVPV